VTNTDGLKPVDVAGSVELRKALFAYPQRPDVPILKGLDLQALAGKRVALVGTSGSGKVRVFLIL
jgi:ABC-type bacteriocin/lantibiotic exporter with double-glycine peptidase domain